jgi:hypothetical protein
MTLKRATFLAASSLSVNDPLPLILLLAADVAIYGCVQCFGLGCAASHGRTSKTVFPGRRGVGGGS